MGLTQTVEEKWNEDKNALFYTQKSLRKSLAPLVCEVLRALSQNSPGSEMQGYWKLGEAEAERPLTQNACLAGREKKATPWGMFLGN